MLYYSLFADAFNAAFENEINIDKISLSSTISKLPTRSLTSNSTEASIMQITINPDNDSSTGTYVIVTIILSVASAVFIICIVVLCYFLRRKDNSNDNNSNQDFQLNSVLNASNIFPHDRNECNL